MYKISRIVLSILLVSLISLACEGPSGTEGPQGAEGPEGPVGPAGEDGSQMYADEGEPGSDIGDEGDFYLDQETGEIYGPKDSDGWGTPVNLSGADGEDGSEIHSGFGSPADSIGTIGDYYLERGEAKLYGPKTEDGWESFIFLRGPQGEPGEDGNANVRSSGWTQLPADDWGESGSYESPDDKYANQIAAASGGWFGLSDTELDGAVLVYVRGALGEPETGGRSTDVIQLPAKIEVSGGGETGGIELRYTHGGNPDYAMWIKPIVGLQSGSWDTDYMIDEYLPSLEFKAVVIAPTTVGKSPEYPPIDYSNYEAVSDYYGFNK